jgi:hypothetical protein
MAQITVGIDPDSERAGFAVYEDGKLIVCATATTPEILTFHLPQLLAVGDVMFSIENVMANQFVYARNRHSSTSAQSKIAMHIGRCQQAQVELMRWLDHYELPYILHKPQKGNWADNKPLFEKVTGWVGRSNPDSRAAAYFGYLGVKK